MDANEIRDRIKRVICSVTSLPAERIDDTTSFRNDLSIDSLTLLEIGVDVDYEFRLNLPEDRFRGLDTVEQTIQLVQSVLAAREPTAQAG